MSAAASRPPGARTPARGTAAVAAPDAAPRAHRHARPGATKQFVLRLYVTGHTPSSSRALEAVRRICEMHLQGRYQLDVIDIYQLPALARDEQIVATPTLIKVLPEPLRRYIGNLSHVEGILFGLDLREKEP